MAGPKAIEIGEDQGPDFSERPYDANDPEQVNLRRRKAGRKAKEQRDFLADVMVRKEGREWVWSLLTVTHVFVSSAQPNDPYTTYFREGERNIGLRILSDVMRAAPEMYVLMQEEANAA